MYTWPVFFIFYLFLCLKRNDEVDQYSRVCSMFDVRVRCRTVGRFNVSALPGGFHNSTAIPGAIDLYEPVLYPRLMATVVVSSSTTVAQEEEKKKTKKKTKKYTETPPHTSIGSEEEKKKNPPTPHTSLAAPPIVLPTNPMTNLMDKTVDRTYTVTYVKPVIHVGDTLSLPVPHDEKT